MQLALTILVVLMALFLTVVVMMQSGKSAGLSGAISGGSDSYLSRNKASTLDSKLARWTKYVAALFLILVLVLSLI